MDNPVQIVVVEDEPRLLRATLRLLKQAGCQVGEAAISRQAWQLAIEKLPDLVLLDVMLPEGNGIALCQRIKAEPALVNSVVALLSGPRTGSEEQARGLEAGADGCITRPIADCASLARV